MAKPGELVMEPLHVVAEVPGQVSLPGGWLALDALLAAAIALRDQLPPPSVQGPVQIPVPLQREPGDRFYLASFAVARWRQHDKRFINRRPVVAEAQALAVPKFRRINLSTGPNKGYRVPLEVGFLEEGRLEWWCVGDKWAVADLLGLVTAVGKKRSVGLGRVGRWTVSSCEPWEVWEGFPVVRDGQPTRPLPPDWPGLADGGGLAYATLDMPYWEKHREEVLRVPPTQGT